MTSLGGVEKAEKDPGNNYWHTHLDRHLFGEEHSSQMGMVGEKPRC